jgi:hypothetical protein
VGRECTRRNGQRNEKQAEGDENTTHERQKVAPKTGNVYAISGDSRGLPASI